jgi:hypothetical protein
MHREHSRRESRPIRTAVFSALPSFSALGQHSLMRKPRIAVILDENTTGDATRYEVAKGYFWESTMQADCRLVFHIRQKSWPIIASVGNEEDRMV